MNSCKILKHFKQMATFDTLLLDPMQGKPTPTLAAHVQAA
jgi:hypothetical protein